MADGQKQSWIRVIFSPLIPMYREIITALLFVNTLALAVPIFTMQVFDRVVPAEEAEISTLTMFGLGMLAVMLLDFFLRQTRSRIMQRDALVTRVELLESKREVDQLQGQIATIKLSIPRAQAALTEANNRIEETRLQFRRKVQVQLGETEVSIARA
jgi:ABC-type bacteriocin/lantibiotic exporter with double-glycine peptidase domain